MALAKAEALQTREQALSDALERKREYALKEAKKGAVAEATSIARVCVVVTVNAKIDPMG